jgi:hypothetical protein
MADIESAATTLSSRKVESLNQAKNRSHPAMERVNDAFS